MFYYIIVVVVVVGVLVRGKQKPWPKGARRTRRYSRAERYSPSLSPTPWSIVPITSPFQNTVYREVANVRTTVTQYNIFMCILYYIIEHARAIRPDVPETAPKDIATIV